jgi:chorismate synthase
MSGTEFGYTLGTPIALHVPNRNVRKRDYSEMLVIPRPGHADYTYQLKYGLRASSGGGRSSARETIGRVASGAIAEKWLRDTYGTEIVCFVSSIGDVEIPKDRVLNQKWTRSQVDQKGKLQLLRGSSSQGSSEWRNLKKKSDEDEENQIELDTKDEACFVRAKESVSEPAYRSLDSGLVYDRNGVEIGKDADHKHDSDDVVAVRCPDASTACKMATLIRKVKSEKDSIGGVVTCVIRNVPVGLGEPCFDKLEAKLAHAMLSLPATKGFEIGSGFRGTRLRGSQHNDAFVKHKDGTPLLSLKTNHAGGTLGGISSGADIVFRVAVKPVSTIGQAQETATFAGEKAELRARGRHDPCVLPRTPPLVEGMAALVLADAAMIQRSRVKHGDSLVLIHDAEIRKKRGLPCATPSGDRDDNGGQSNSKRRRTNE